MERVPGAAVRFSSFQFTGVVTAVDTVEGTITLRDDAGNPVGSFTTLADGSFGTTGLKPRTYTLQAKTADGKTVDATIKLTGGEISTVELKLP